MWNWYVNKLKTKISFKVFMQKMISKHMLILNFLPFSVSSVPFSMGALKNIKIWVKVITKICGIVEKTNWNTNCCMKNVEQFCICMLNIHVCIHVQCTLYNVRICMHLESAVLSSRTKNFEYSLQNFCSWTDFSI